MNLNDFGWNEYFRSEFEKYSQNGYVPCRVIQQHRNMYVVISEQGELQAEVSGKMRHQAGSRSNFPAVGDWVAAAIRPDEGKATIHALLPRQGCFSRKMAGQETEEQVLAANIDTVFLVSGLDGDFNPRRIERYLTLSWESGANPVIVLNKTDICENLEEKIGEVESIAFGIPVLPISAIAKSGLESIREYLQKGKTAAFLGSSGVGKSTIINSLLGYQRMFVQEVREDDSRGRHTTTSRELILLPEGGILVDTPGMREIQLWADEDGLRKTFDDIEEIAALCRFRDCSHSGEPDCAIQVALEEGSLDRKRWESYLKLQKELKYLAARQDVKERRRQERDWDKKIRNYFKQMKELKKRKGL